MNSIHPAVRHFLSLPALATATALAMLELSNGTLRAENEIGFVEKFALAADREAVLTQLIPGSEEYYLYHALHYQNSNQPAKLRTIMEQWGKRFPNSAGRRVIENRAAMISYDITPQATLKFLRERLQPELNHQAQERDKKPEFPTALEPAAIAYSAFLQKALVDDDLHGCSDAALEMLVREKTGLRPPQRRALLARLARPDLPGLVALIETDLRTRESRGFGEFAIHRLLLPEQMDELAAAIPALYDNQAYVLARLRKLLPSADADADFDPAEREAWLERTWAYVSKLSPAFNSLKAQILFRRLHHDRTRGVYDKARFLAYLQLPRRAGYMNPKYFDDPVQARHPADLNASFNDSIPGGQPIGNDEPLVRDFLLQFLRDEDTWEPWSVWLRDSYLKPLFAEAKIVNGIGDPEKWASLLTPSAYQALKDRVDVDFSPGNPAFLQPQDAARLELQIKNVPKLLVKLFELNTLSYFLTQKRQLNTDVSLDGLVATKETTYDYAADPAGRSPLRRVTRTFDFPELKGRRGAWVIEFIGGGKSSRALLRKGQWQVLQQTGPAGEMLTVLDEQLAPVKDAVVWLDGRKYVPDEQSGYIHVPFTAQAGSKPVILADAAGEFATLTQFEHHAETYRLDAQFHLEREQLLGGREAALAIRATLLLGDAQVAPELLKTPVVTLTTTTLDGVSATKEVKDVKLEAGKVFVHSFPVPPRLASVTAKLWGQVENLSKGGSKEDLSAEHTFEVNGIDKSENIADGMLSQFGGSYVFEYLGRNGEALGEQPITFNFTYRGFNEPVEVELATDAAGRVALGALSGISEVAAALPNQLARTWTVSEAGALRPKAMHGRADEILRVPWVAEGALRPGQVSLLEKRGDTFVQDRFSTLSLKEGFLEIKGLPPGDYALMLREENHEITLRITAGQPLRGWLVSPTRQLEASTSAPVQIESAKAEGETVVVHLRHANPFTRLHVAAARFIPYEWQLAGLGNFVHFDPALAQPSRRPNLYVAGRAIGDEYRYILDRRYAHIYPGNMLTRPRLLLNPWEVRSTDLNEQALAQSEALRRLEADREHASRAGAATGGGELKSAAEASSSSDLDFLAAAAPVFYNLTPDNSGVVRIDRKALGDRQYVQLYAEDLTSAAWRTLALPEAPTKFADLRLTRNLDPAKSFTEKKEITVLRTGQTLTLADLATSELETYDSLAGAYSLLSALHPDANFTKFSFLLQWPKLKPEEKRAKYSEFACHELNFFLSRKDPDFFASVVQPYLNNKKDRTFLDDYLLGHDLKRYLEPWSHERLNVVERALLAQRIAGEGPSTARHLRELWELLPVDLDAQDRLFETGLRGRALTESETALVLGDEKAEAAAAPLAPDPAKTGGFANTGNGRVGGAMLPQAAPATPVPASARAFHAVPGLDEPALAPERKAAALDLSGTTREALGEKAKSSSLAFESAARKDSAAVPGEPQDKSAFKLSNAGTLGGLVSSAEATRLRREVRQYYRQLGPTKEWAEDNYYHLPQAAQLGDLVKINAFWNDYAAWDGKAPFLSEHLAEAASNFTEMILALSVLDLPFDPAKQIFKREGAAFTLTAGSSLIAYHKQIKPAAPPAAGQSGAETELLVSQNFYQYGERYREEGNEKFDKYVTDEFLSGVVYGANIVVTNPGSAPQKLALLLQIPRGALPALGSKATDSRRLRLEPYTTQTFDYYFYFPMPDAKPFPHYPVQVSRNETMAGAARPFIFKVVKRLSEVDKTSWDYVSQNGPDGDVLAFLETHNLVRLDPEKAAWRARRSPAFFHKLVALLEKHHVWSEPVYRYALVHNEPAALREWLRHRDDFVAECGPWLQTKLLSIDPVERGSYQHLEFSPLVNQRANRLGAEPKIPNPVFRSQYQQLLQVFARKPALDDADNLSVVYYLFLQDRVEEALARLHAMQPQSVATRLQYDYFQCYAAFYEGDTSAARLLASRYAAYPVDKWRTLFAEAAAQLDEIEGKKAARPGDPEPDRDRQQAELAASEPFFDLKVENSKLALTWRNLRDVTINYYLMDPEFLFSASPFVTQDAARFSIVKPTQTAALTLPAGRDALEIPLPAAFTKADVLVEVLAAGQRKAQAYHANTLKLTLAEAYGRLEVRDSLAGQPVPKTYAKVYARLSNGAVRFFKDGYTDLRGRFDYASLNSGDDAGRPRATAVNGGGASGLDYPMLAPQELGDVERLAVLVLSDEHGAAVREIAPPTQ